MAEPEDWGHSHVHIIVDSTAYLEGHVHIAKGIRSSFQPGLYLQRSPLRISLEALAVKVGC